LVADPPTQTPTQAQTLGERLEASLNEIDRTLRKRRGRIVDLEELFNHLKSMLPEECNIVREREYLDDRAISVSASLMSEDFKVRILSWTVDRKIVCGKEAVARITLYTYGIHVINEETDSVTDSADVVTRYTITNLIGEGGG